MLSLLFCSSSILLGGCGLFTPYTAPVIQGKDINNGKVMKIKPDMTKSQVKYLLGSPDIIDTFNPNEYMYINTYKPHMQSDNLEENELVLTFNNKDKLVGISGNYAPPTKEPVF